MSEVKVITESYKSIPKLNELYEHFCYKNGVKFYLNIKKTLIESEQHGILSLKSLLYDINQLSFQFDVIFESILFTCKQSAFDEFSFTKNLTKIDFSSNHLSDQILDFFFENLFFSLKNLKFLNLSNNKFSIKSLKNLFELTNSKKIDFEKNSCVSFFFD